MTRICIRRETRGVPKKVPVAKGCWWPIRVPKFAKRNCVNVKTGQQQFQSSTWGRSINGRATKSKKRVGVRRKIFRKPISSVMFVLSRV